MGRLAQDQGQLFRAFDLDEAVPDDHPVRQPQKLCSISPGSRCGGSASVLTVDRIRPGNPRQNGRHERVRLTQKQETTRPAADNILAQQARFDDFVDCYNTKRPHQAIAMQVPADPYQPSSRQCRVLENLDYPFHDKTVIVTSCGRICQGRRKINLSTVFAGQAVGIKQVEDQIWLVSFMTYDLGYFDHETGRLEPIANPFAAKVYPCLRNKL